MRRVELERCVGKNQVMFVLVKYSHPFTRRERKREKDICVVCSTIFFALLLLLSPRRSPLEAIAKQETKTRDERGEEEEDEQEEEEEERSLLMKC